MNRTTSAITLAIAVAALTVAGCKRDAEAPAAAPATAAPVEEIKSAVISEIDHNSPASAAPGFDVKAFAGTYGGTLPCADCSGIDTTIAFTPEGGYTMSETYQDSDGSNFVTKGSWTVGDDGKSLLLDPEDKAEYDRHFEVVSATELHALDRQGKPIDGKLGNSLRRR
ncbi:MAG: copper resistance protein NlpE [Lysobacteraceae bacterium]|nr:MAG: copper resistance protein NlpE [Xanthomonadaceae bacterium]